MRVSTPIVRLLALITRGIVQRLRSRGRNDGRGRWSYGAAMIALVLLMGWLMIQPSTTLSSKQATRRAKPSSQIKATLASRQTTGGTQSPNDAATPMGEEDAAISLSSDEASPSPSEEAAAASPSEAGKWKSELPKLFTQNHPSQQTPRGTGAVFQPISRQVKSFPAVNVRKAAQLEALQPALPMPSETMSVDPPEEPPIRHFGVPILRPGGGVLELQSEATTTLTPSFGTGISPGSAKNFKGEFLSSTTIPPDTMGAVGTTHIVTSSNDRLRIQTRDGIEVSRVTMSSFWAGVTIKGVAASAFDTKVYFDRFNNRFILISSANGTSVNSGALFAVSATADPTGTWYRWSVVADPASTGTPNGSGNWIDYPTVGLNKNWIVIDENVFHYTCNTTTCTNQSYFGQQVYVLDKQAAYSNTLSTINLFQADFNATCQTSATPESELACGFTMAPAITEDNTTDTEYLVEDWDSTAGQLRLSKITGTPSAPSLTVGTQFPQSSESWRFDAARIGTSGGYAPQRQQSANLPSGSRIMANDSRIQNAVLRNNKLWATHTVMLASSSQPAGTTIGGAGNPIDNHSGIQWWQIDPTNETAASTPPLQRGRIQDHSANNCHNGTSGTSAVAPCNGTTAAQFGTFFAFPNISVNQNEDVLIGFSQFSPLTYPSAAYAVRRAADPPNTTRDVVVFRPGQSNYNIGAGSGSSRQDRWGDYSAAQTDPLDDTNFWTMQEYAGTNRNDFLNPSYAGPWETWWALINPGGTVPSNSGTLIISEFRLRGPQGARDEFVELYNPSNVPVIVQTTDNSDGWALVYSADGTAFTQVFAVIPNGTVIPPHGHFLLADNPDNTAGGTSALTYSLNNSPATQVRGADSDFGWSLDLADNGGIALFNTATTANFSNTTRLDSVGFSSIAAGLFKEGNGIPAISTTTPTGQITFYRDLSGGTPKDTGFNENDFIFANTVVGETLGSNPRLGAPGPENLSSPVTLSGATTLPAALVDTGVGYSSAPNLLRDSTAVTNGAFGTLTFRRAFTNNTGADLPRLRFLVVDMTTNPPSGSNADLRALSASATIVSLSGGGTANIAATTLETPPTQSAGGGINGTLTVPSVTLSAPFTSGATVNLQFTLGVQTTGNYNFCLVPESVTASTVPSPLCFSGTTENTPPQITGGSTSINAGAPATMPTIATVSDGQNSAGSLTVTAISVPSGITVTGITNTVGTVTANVSASCGLGSAAYNVILQVVDSEGATSNATFIVNVTATPAPTTPTITGTTNGTGTSDQACPEQPLTLTATSTGATSYQWYQDNNLLNGATSSSYQATGVGTYYVTATNACGTTAQSAGYVVQNPTPHSPFVTIRNQPSTTTTIAICQGSVILDSDSATGIQWWKDGSPIPGAGSQSYTVTASGVYTAQLNALGCHSQFGRNITVTVNPTPATPTVTPGGPTTFCAGGSVTLTSSSASGNQWYLNGSPIGGATSNTYNATASGSYTVAVTDGNSCLSAASSATTVTVNPIPATPTITPNGQTTLCNGSVTLTSSSASGNQWYLNGSPIGGATNQTYNATTPGAYTVIVTTTGCSSAASAATTVVANPLPTLTYGNQTTTFSGLLAINPATGPSDNTSVSSIVLQSQGTYTGTISVNNLTGAVSISNAAPVGMHTITIRAIDSCGGITDASFTLTVNKADQTISSFGLLTDKIFGDADFNVSATATSSLSVGFGATGNCTVTGNTVHITGAGSCTITASQGGNANYNAAPSVQRSFNVSKASSTTAVTVSNAIYDGQPHGSTATATGAGSLNQSVTVSYTGRNATVYGPSTTAPTKAGDYTASATFSGDANHTGSNDSKDFQITKANQTITFNALADKTFGEPDFSVSATASSNLAVSFSVNGQCTLVGSTVHLTAAGSCAVTASQVGDGNYNAAANVPRSFNIVTAAATTNLSSSVNPSDFGQSVTFTATVTSTAGTPSGTVQFKDGAANLGSPVTLNSTGVATFNTAALAVGTRVITAEYSGNTNFAASTGTLSGGQVVNPQPSLSINDVSLLEGNSGTATAVFTVTLSQASNLTVKVDFSSANGSATAGSDYAATNGMLIFNPGDLTKTITVLVNGDTANENDETFFVNLSNPVNATISDNQGLGTILNDDAPAIQLSSSAYSVNENGQNVAVIVNRSGDTSAAATVDYTTSDNADLTPCSTANGIASQRCDYALSVGTLHFAAGESSKTIFIPIVDDSYVEGAETFTIALSNPTGGSLGAQSSATITILDNEAANGPNPIPSAAFFIRQQYIDFLGREPEPAGLQGWLNILANCGTTVQQPCDRIEVSADFFRSDEFQQRGYFIYRFYAAALGRIPRYSEFMPDAAKVSGFLSTMDLETMKAAFVQDFMNRTEFKTRYDPTLNNPTAYVNLLEQTAGVTLSNKQALITGLQNGTETRATVLRKFIESTEVTSKFFNEAFVVEAYFGYLRRDPDILYLQWIQTVNQTGGYRTLVNGFMNSNEYVLRFGP